MNNTNENTTDEYDVKRYNREKVSLEELKLKVKADILTDIDSHLDLILDKLINKTIEDFESDESKICLFVSTTHDYPCNKCSKNCDTQTITSLPKILRENRKEILQQLGKDDEEEEQPILQRRHKCVKELDNQINDNYYSY